MFFCLGWKTCSLITWVKPPHPKRPHGLLQSMSEFNSLLRRQTQPMVIAEFSVQRHCTEIQHAPCASGSSRLQWSATFTLVMNMRGSINKEVLTSTVAGLVDVFSPSDALTCKVNFESSLSISEQATRTWPESGSTWNISAPSPPTTKWDMTELGSKSSSEAWNEKVSFVVKALKTTLR